MKNLPTTRGNCKAKPAVRVTYVRFYPTDWRSGCIGLSLEQEGLYIRLCAYVYETGLRLSLDDTLAAKFMGVHTNAYRKIRDQLIALGKVVRTASGYTVPRAERELGAAADAQSGQETRTVAPQSEWGAVPDTLGDTPLDTPLDTTHDTGGVFSKKPNENYARLKSQEREGKKEKSSVARRGSRLADDWSLPDDWRSWARVTFPHATDAMVTDQADRFRDYWHAKAGQAACKLDWQATWRNWCRTGLATAPVRAAANVAPWKTAAERKIDGEREFLAFLESRSVQ